MIAKEKGNRAAYLDETSKRQKIIDQLVQKRILTEREEHKMPYQEEPSESNESESGKEDSDSSAEPSDQFASNSTG